MKLQEIIKSLPNSYNSEIEKELIKKVESIKAVGLTTELADLLSFAISEHYNKLALSILEKDYNGKKLDLESINNSIINQSNENYSLLHFTAQFGNKKMLLYFLEQNIPITFDKDQLSPLHTLTFAKNLSKEQLNKIIKKMKEIDPEILHHKDRFNLSALHYAAHNNNQLALEALIANGARN